MSLYSSRPPFNDDPYPWYSEDAACEFDRPQHNPTNPILTWYREIVPVDAYADRARYVLHTWEDVRDLAVPEATDAHSEHARRVLTRIAAIADGAS